MSSTVFRAATPVSSESMVTAQAPEDKSRVLETSVEPPYMDYAKEKGHPFSVDHYELQQFWNNSDMYDGAFREEVGIIDEYLNYMITKGEVNNTLESARNELKRIEKLVNVKKDARTSMKVGLVSEYAKFLLNSENIKKESAKYGMI